MQPFALAGALAGFFLGSSAALAAAGDDHGNARATATDVALPSRTDGSIEPGNDADYFRFAVAESETVTIESFGELDTLGTLFDASGARIEQDDDGAGRPNFRIERTLDAGAYYVRIHSRGTATGGYALRLRGRGAGETLRDCDACPLMVQVPAGSFRMGAPEGEPRSADDERPQHTVALPAFAASAEEVTFAEWDACVADGGCGYRPADEGWGRSNRPVINVSWEDAQRYAGWLSGKTGRTYRLPTEAEWEYAARAGTTTPFHRGVEIWEANFDRRCSRIYFRERYWDHDPQGRCTFVHLQTLPAGSFSPNAFGLYDMHGNVREWVQDCWHGSYRGAPRHGAAWERGDCEYGVLRGGSWRGEPEFLRSANRSRDARARRQPINGFRVAATLAHDHGDSRSLATSVALRSATAGTIDPGNDADYFRFEVSSRARFVMESWGELDTLGTLFDATGARIVQDDHGAGGANFRIERTLDAGTYYLRVHSRGRETGRYALHITVAPGVRFRDCEECPLMVAVPAGSFLMGAPESEPHTDSNERPQHTASVRYFAVGANEVTFAEWDACVAERGCRGYHPDDEGWGRANRPVINVSRADAHHYVDWLSGKTGQPYRLPVEREWEYAARAGTTTPFHTGATISPQQANYDGRHEYASDDDESGHYRGQTEPVASFPPNAFGLYDMHGNALEWVDFSFRYPIAWSFFRYALAWRYAVDGVDYRGWEPPTTCWDGARTAIPAWRKSGTRGGSWFDAPWDIRSAARGRLVSLERRSFSGFRVAHSLTPPGDDDHGNSRSFATRVALLSTTTGTIHPGNDADYFRFSVPAKGAVAVRSTGKLDTLGTLFDASGTRIEQNDDGAGYPNFRIERTLDPGVYYIRVHSRRTATGAYALHLRGPSEDGGTTLVPGDSFRDCDACPLMVVVPSGSFLMGASWSEPVSVPPPDPQHIALVRSFAAGAFEVTFAEWEACVAGGGCGGYRPADEGWGRSNRPVIDVSWEDAQRYVDWLSRKTGHPYRLPSEREWEYAARADTSTPFHTGETISAQEANYDGRYEYPSGDYKESGLFRGQTIPVGSFAPNAFGLYDVHGNVLEWVQDCDAEYGHIFQDGHNCQHYVLRGGAWDSRPVSIRSAFRTYGRLDTRDFYGKGNRGFRVARTLTP